MPTQYQPGKARVNHTGTTWTIDPAHSTIGFAIKHMMITTVHGRFGGVRGTIRLDDDHPHNAAVEVDTGNARRDDELRAADFFDVATYPTIAFRSTRVEPASPLGRDHCTVAGDLTIRDVTRSVEPTAEATGKICCKHFGMTANLPSPRAGG
jgi:polyisoprenoid-binding protein YceI